MLVKEIANCLDFAPRPSTPRRARLPPDPGSIIESTVIYPIALPQFPFLCCFQKWTLNKIVTKVFTTVLA